MEGDGHPTRHALYERADLPLERGALHIQLSEPSEIRAGELGSPAGQTVEETGDRSAVAGPGEVRDLALVVSGKHDQVRVEAVRNPSPLTHPHVPRIDEDLEILGDPGHRDRGEALLAKGHPGDREGVARIALARPAEVPALAIGEHRGHLNNPLTRSHEQPRQGRAERARVLDPEAPLRAVRLGPAQDPDVPLAIVRERPRPVSRPVGSIALTASVALWVSIPIVTIAGPPSRAYTRCARPGGQACVRLAERDHAPDLSRCPQHPGHAGRRVRGR